MMYAYVYEILQLIENLTKSYIYIVRKRNSEIKYSVFNKYNEQFE